MTGGSPIISYELQMDDGLGGQFNEVVGFTTPYTLNSRIITSNIDSGRQYRFRYRAQNIHGFGDFSPETTILSATIPDEPAGEPQTIIEPASTLVTLDWNAPASTGGDSIQIIEYKVFIAL